MEGGGEKALQNLMWGGGGGGLNTIHGGSMRGGGAKMLSKKTCEGVHSIIKLPAISLQDCKFTKDELHTYFSRISAIF